MEWTLDQKKVIERRDDNVLVSASAGSGKTAVLVARIMAYIIEDRVDIDDLLIVTFTRAAAGEMRERIAKAISKALAEDPDNEHLERQTTLIHNAQITTIDGFCSYVLGTYCHLTDLEPGYRVGDSGELDLLRADVLRDFLMECHEELEGEEKQAFYTMVETFATGKNEDVLDEVVEKVFLAAQCQPDPSAWLLACREMDGDSDFKELYSTAWMRRLIEGADVYIEDALRQAQENLALAQMPDGPTPYISAAQSDLKILQDLMNHRSYGERHEIVVGVEFEALSRVRAKKSEDPAKRKRFKTVREEIKNVIEDKLRPIYAQSEEEVLSGMQGTGPVLRTLLDLTERFLKRYDAAKREKKLIDFPDIEHFALRILRNPDGSRTQAARELAGRFREVMCDEYQDSNLLQESILTAVSRVEDGDNNYFCVGDVKQSIYSFRNAKPDLFMDKFARYTHGGRQGAVTAGKPLSSAGSGTRIDLCWNFRSRHEVLDAANGIFEQIMMYQIGRVEYDEEAMLVPKAVYPEKSDSYTTEILTINMGEKGADGKPILDDKKADAKRDAEARLIAERIRHMVECEKLYDPETGEERPVEYRDIVILLRTMKGWADGICSVLEGMGIPAYSTQKTGYFEAIEVRTLLNYLKIIDNPEQDIPFAAVLRSPIVGLSADDLARIRLVSGPLSVRENSYLSMAECVRRFAKSGSQDALSRRLEDFLTFFDRMREVVPYTPLHELIWMILTETGYMDYVSALPGGAQRVANLRLLMEKSIDYEQTSYVGLFNFVRYIDRMVRKDIEISGVNVIGEHENVVRIVSIHKSKGLEYPIVFLAGCDKKFNKADTRSKLLIDEEFGLATDFVDLGLRAKTTTLKKEALKEKQAREAMGEELRVLYVAMTRAKQKLIMVGTADSEEKYEDMKNLTLPLAVKHLPENFVLNAESPQQLIWPAADRLIARYGRKNMTSPIVMTLISPSQLVGSEITQRTRLAETIRMLESMDGDKVWDPETRRIIEERYSYVYPYASHARIPAKVSVSELKHGAYADEEAEETYPEPEIVPFIPDFMRSRMKKTDGGPEETEEVSGGTYRGTAYHKVMELLRYGDIYSFDGTNAALRSQDEKVLTRMLHRMCVDFVSSGRLEAEELQTIRMRDIARFAESSLGHRMAIAAMKGELYREQPFVLGVPASDIRKEFPEDEQIIVQGIIDAFFYEEGQVILVDYKTDRVDLADELISRYRVQLDSYAEALGRLTGRKVSRKLIYSFHLGTEIPV